MKLFLSILTCSLTQRAFFLKRLEKEILKQTKNASYVEMLASVDSGEKSIGQKRNELLLAAKGDYIVFIDDDDLVACNYVSSIINAIMNKKPDCVGIKGVLIEKNKPNQYFLHSIKYKTWYTKNSIHYRCPNHLNPVKRSLALDTRFENISSGEDYDYSLRLNEKLKTEVFINQILYYYYPSKK